MSFERTWVGLDVHARSVVAGVIDDLTGEVMHLRVAPGAEQVVAWVGSLPGPVMVAYEAGLRGSGWPGRCGRLGCGVRWSRPAPVGKLLLRRGLVWDGSTWGAAHEQWLNAIRLDRPGLQLASEEAREAVWVAHARRDRLDAAITQAAVLPEWAPVVGRLSCLRGVGTLTAFGLAVEIGDWDRFTGSTIGAYLGLVPSESSTGSRREQGPITKTGNGHARRLLVEAAWHHRKRYRPTRELLRRQEHQPAHVRHRADQGNRRLHRRWAQLDARGKRSTISAVAIARELAGWTWSLATMHDPAMNN